MACKVSFIHAGGPGMASYRYRAQMPAQWLGVSLNDASADVVVLAKPQPQEGAGKTVVADFCDDHFDRFPHYRELLKTADAITCPTDWMRGRILGLGRDATVIPEAAEYPEVAPHCNGDAVLWFGNSTNLSSLLRVMPELDGVPLRAVSNAPGCIPWSRNAMLAEFALADIVILPATKEYKSPNRAVEAIRQGCFVVAEPHPSLKEFPIWKGNIKEGIEWASRNPSRANEMTRAAQEFISRNYSPKTVASAWRKVIRSVCTWDAESIGGTAG